MDVHVTFTKHALQKFEILERHGIVVSHAQVQAIVVAPEQTSVDALGNPIAQGRLDEAHVLRVIYRVEGNQRIVITFYPGRRERCED